MFLALLLQVHQVFTGYWKFSPFPSGWNKAKYLNRLKQKPANTAASPHSFPLRMFRQERRLRQCQKFPTDDVDECLHDQVVMEFQN